jgi:hypothetical protein
LLSCIRQGLHRKEKESCSFIEFIGLIELTPTA